MQVRQVIQAVREIKAAKHIEAGLSSIRDYSGKSRLSQRSNMFNHFSVARPSSRGRKGSSGIERLQETNKFTQVQPVGPAQASSKKYPDCFRITRTPLMYLRKFEHPFQYSRVKKKPFPSEHTKVAGRKACPFDAAIIFSCKAHKVQFETCGQTPSIISDEKPRHSE